MSMDSRGKSIPDLSRLRMVFGLDRRGFVYLGPDIVYREVCADGIEVLEYIIHRNLLCKLIENGLVETQVVTMEPIPILKHEYTRFATTPAEWSPSMLKDVALFLCRFNEVLSDYGLTLSDGHALNVTFRRGRPVLLDFGSITFLSEMSNKGRPQDSTKKIRDFSLKIALRVGQRLPPIVKQWVGRHTPSTLYSELRGLRKEVQGFHWLEEFRSRVLVPLWIASTGQKEVMTQFLRTEPRGLGYHLARTKWRRLPPWFYQIRRTLNREGWRQSLRVLEERIEGLSMPLDPDVWTTYTERYPEEKAAKYSVILDALERSKPKTITDLGANIGELPRRIVNQLDLPVCAVDVDIDCIEYLYRHIRGTGEQLQPAVLDVIFPNPSTGSGTRRPGSVERFSAEMVLCLALVHHLVIRCGLSMKAFAAIIADYSLDSLIVEFVEPTDKHVQSWQRSGFRIPNDYSLDDFLKSFAKYFSSYSRLNDYHDTRSLYLFSGKISRKKLL